MDIFTISIDYYNIEQTIYYTNVLNEEEVNRENVWYFSPSQNYVDTWNFIVEVQSALEKRYQDKNVIVTIPVSYYKISYHDYLNDYKEDYYYDYDGYVSYDDYKSKEINEGEKDNYKYNFYIIMTANLKNDRELIKQSIKVIISNYDRYYTKKDILV